MLHYSDYGLIRKGAVGTAVMHDDLSIEPSYPWRLAAFALMIACCGFTGWLLGHAAALCAPVLTQIANVLDDARAVPALQEFMARVSGS